VCPIAVATALSHHLTYIEIDEAGAVRGTGSPYREQPSKRDTSLRNVPAQDGRLIPALVTVCYSLKITLKRPLLTVNPPLPA
jgi:hypothetical protein